MRSLRVGLVLATVMLAAYADAASARPVSGTITRGAGDLELRIELRNDGTESDLAADIDLPPGYSVLNATLYSGAAGNCSPSQSKPERVQCFFDPPGWAPGATIVVIVNTSPRLPDNAGATAYACGIPCDPNMKDGPYAITGPAPASAGPAADLGVRVTHLPFESGSISYDLAATGRDWRIFFSAEANNLGPADAMGVRVDLDAPVAPPGTEADAGPSLANLSAAGCDAVAPSATHQMCTSDSLASGDSFALIYRMTILRPGSISLTANISSATPDPNAGNNSDAFTDTIEDLPVSGVENLTLRSRRLRLAGRAVNTRRVRAAVAKLDGGARVVDKPAAGSRSARASAQARASAAGCRWVRATRVRFRRERGRRCDDPSYVTARVKRGRWSIRFRGKLPRGRYVVFTLGESADGVIENGVSKKLGNFRTFRVK